MASLNDKTPVSCLQEYLVSVKMIPKYELIHHKVGTHNPTFTYRVQVGNLWEDGTGRSKQEAKHRAAEKMLKSLKVIDTEATEEERNGATLESTENYVGLLKELCFVLHYPEPKYDLEEAAGPPHSRVFKMICSVSKLQEFGISKTKKQAKHQAAFKMLERLKSSSKDAKEVFHSDLKFTFKTPGLTDDEATDKYCTLRSFFTSSLQDPAAFYKDHHKAYVGLEKTSSTLSELLNKTNIADFESSLGLLQAIAKELEVKLTSLEVPSKSNLIIYTVMSMSVFPPIAAIGISEKNAAFNLLNSLLVLCKE